MKIHNCLQKIFSIFVIISILLVQFANFGNRKLYAADLYYGWTKTIGNTGSEVGYDVVTDSDGNIFVSGQFNENVDFNPGVGVY